MQPVDTTRKRKTRIVIAFIALIIIVIGVVKLRSNPNNANNNSSGLNTTTPSNYKDGTYTATGEYSSPGGDESINITVTLSNNIVTSTSAVSGANDPTAASYQSDFINGYKQYVVGKNINTIKLSNVAGSSLTPQGFDNALQQIEQQAKA